MSRRRSKRKEVEVRGQKYISPNGQRGKEQERPARPEKKRRMKMLNKVMLIGRLGADPEVRYTQSGTPVASFSIATSEQWTKDGEREERTEWHRVVAWGRLGEVCGEYLTKGKLVYIEGKLHTRIWEDKDGVKRYVAEILSQKMQMLDRAGSNGNGSRKDEPPEYADSVDNDFPF
jgi:single-strand DNA-binding protein